GDGSSELYSSDPTISGPGGDRTGAVIPGARVTVSWLRDESARESFTRAPGMTAPVRSPTVPLMVPPSGSAGEGSWAVAFGAPEGCGDCARAGKEQSRRTQNKRKLGHTQGRLPLPKTNLRRVRPRDFPEESFLAEFAIAPFFTVRPYLAPDKALTRQRGPKFQSYDCCWMTLAGYGLDGRKQTGLPRYALRQARLGRTGAPERKTAPGSLREKEVLRKGPLVVDPLRIAAEAGALRHFRA